MSVKALSYIGVNSDRLEEWSDYSEKCLGMQELIEEKALFHLEWMIISND